MITDEIYAEILEYLKEVWRGPGPITPRREMECRDLWRAVSGLEIHQGFVRLNVY